jgi:hypothetical protein
MKLLDEEIPLKENLLASILNYWILWLFLIISGALDFFSTLHFIHIEGVDKEANLVIRILVYSLGVNPGVALGKLLQLFSAMAFSALSLKYSRAILMVMIGLNVLAVIQNLR